MVLLLLTFCLLLLPLWESVIVLYFVVRYFMSILVLQSSWWGWESWLLCLICLPGVSWWLSSSSSWCHGVVCSLWLWYFLIILTIFAKKIPHTRFCKWTNNMLIFIFNKWFLRLKYNFFNFRRCLPSKWITTLMTNSSKFSLLHKLNLRNVKKLSCKLYEIISIIRGNMVFWNYTLSKL